MGVRDPGAGDIDSLKLPVGNHPRCQRIAGPRNDHGLAPVHLLPKPATTIGKSFHK